MAVEMLRGPDHMANRMTCVFTSVVAIAFLGELRGRGISWEDRRKCLKESAFTRLAEYKEVGPRGNGLLFKKSRTIPGIRSPEEVSPA